MRVVFEPRSPLAVCLNPAWQKTLVFKHLEHGSVNRAVSMHECGGGKGVNVIRVFRNLGLPAGIACFVGGTPGERLLDELRSGNAACLAVRTAGVTRCCFTVISRDNAEVTELIEPSAPVTGHECDELLSLILEALPRHGAIAFCGSVPPGVTPDFAASLARAARGLGIPFVLDAVNDVPPVLREGVTLLKVNASELRKIADSDNIDDAAASLLAQYPLLEWLAVTDGPQPASLFGRTGTWRFTVPSLTHVVSAIGGGDCATAIMTRRLAESCAPSQVTSAFAEALACATASCLTDTPSVFAPEEAAAILKEIRIDDVF